MPDPSNSQPHDDDIREQMGSVPIVAFEDPAFCTPVPLEQARVAVVTTGGLHAEDQEKWGLGDESFRVLPQRADRLVLGHKSPNYDRAGFLADPNVIVPLDRLQELASEGVIGSVADRHFSFMGAQKEAMSTIRLDTGPNVSKQLREDGVDVVLITPICPLCTRTGGTLAHVLEANGLATVAISLVRPISERLEPPRSLFCRFPFGRPLGRPNDPAFQRRVLLDAFGLLKEPGGPVLRDFPEVVVGGGDQLSCPIGPTVDASLPSEVDEALGLRSAYGRQRSRSGRTNLGRTVDVDGVPGLLEKLLWVRDGATWEEAQLPNPPRDAAADLRAYYEEAALALVDHTPEAHSTTSWFFNHTKAGKLLRDVQASLRDQGVDRDIWTFLVPRTFA